MSALHISRVRALYPCILLLHRVLPPDLKDLGDQLISQRSPRPPAGKGSGAVRTQGWALLSAALTEALGGSSC
ncbi:unnamed protein product [Rangifer tarandus platyrhynchus]|uniref:Uncharacterized protein n=1 Tax=Rangifer tarandus platyrhynchus TaxID=3082113 RepID=A0AC59Y0A6_RANTA